MATNGMNRNFNQSEYNEGYTSGLEGATVARSSGLRRLNQGTSVSSSRLQGMKNGANARSYSVNNKASETLQAELNGQATYGGSRKNRKSRKNGKSRKNSKSRKNRK